MLCSALEIRLCCAHGVELDLSSERAGESFANRFVRLETAAGKCPKPWTGGKK